MPSTKNTQLLQEAKERQDKSNAMFFVDYQGLTHLQLEEARHALADINAELAITKNTLANLALQEKKLDVKEKLQGPLAILYSYGDAVAAAKFLQDFFKKYELPKIKFAYFEGKVLDEGEIKALASLPPREVLLAKLVGTLQAPISSLVYNLNYPIARLAYALKAIEKKKGAI